MQFVQWLRYLEEGMSLQVRDIYINLEEKLEVLEVRYF